LHGFPTELELIKCSSAEAILKPEKSKTPLADMTIIVTIFPAIYAADTLGPIAPPIPVGFIPVHKSYTKGTLEAWYNILEEMGKKLQIPLYSVVLDNLMLVSIRLGYEYQCKIGLSKVVSGVVVGIVHTIYSGTKKKCLYISSTTNRDANAEVTILVNGSWCRLAAATVIKLIGSKMNYILVEKY